MPRKYYCLICVLCALWTIIQTSFHLVFVIFNYYLGICEKSPSDPDEIFFYLTYLYNKDCGVPKLQNSSQPIAPENYIYKIVTKIFADTSNTTTLEGVVEALLLRLDYFPDSVASSSRTSVFLLCFLILDGSWIVSAVSLLMGTCFGIKESLSLVFYGPWLVMTICVSIFDVTASVFFGFDIAQTLNFDNWLHFVGITDTTPFSDINSSNISFEITATPSIVLCSISSRFILIWISNWVAFIFVMKATISVYHETYKNESSNGHIESPYPQRTRIDHDTSAARIRSWQLFYGAVDANTTRSSHSSKSFESEKDLNSNSRENVGSDNENCSHCYYGYPDVAENVVGESGGYLEELRGQLPWSYTRPLEGRGKGEERIELENVGRRHQRIKSDSSSSGTEL